MNFKPISVTRSETNWVKCPALQDAKIDEQSSDSLSSVLFSSHPEQQLLSVRSSNCKCSLNQVVTRTLITAPENINFILARSKVQVFEIRTCLNIDKPHIVAQSTNILAAEEESVRVLARGVSHRASFDMELGQVGEFIVPPDCGHSLGRTKIRYLTHCDLAPEVIVQVQNQFDIIRRQMQNGRIARTSRSKGLQYWNFKRAIKSFHSVPPDFCKQRERLLDICTISDCSNLRSARGMPMHAGKASE